MMIFNMVGTINVSILDAPADIIIQCNNCQNTQGSGVAKAIRAKYPEVYTEDCKTVKGDRNKLGTILPVKILKPDNDIKYVFLCYGQFNYGREKRQVNYEALFRCFEATKAKALELGLYRVAAPHLMASNLAGGDFRIVQAMIESVFLDSEINFYICQYVN